MKEKWEIVETGKKKTIKKKIKSKINIIPKAPSFFPFPLFPRFPFSFFVANISFFNFKNSNYDCNKLGKNDREEKTLIQFKLTKF